MTDPKGILNWRRIDERITTSGQPSEEQMADLKVLGVTTVINLGPNNNKGALKDEAGTLAALGLKYVYIPVKFQNPTEEDYAQFVQAMKDASGETVHVHCIYNARVSAFFYRYLGGTDAALQNMDSIWRPENVWATLIGRKPSHLPHQYAGDDY